MKGMINKRYTVKELRNLLVECAEEVHNELGKGFIEDVYARAMAVEMKLHGLYHVKNQPITYKGIGIGSKKIYYNVEDQMMIQIKCVKELSDDDSRQGKRILESLKIFQGIVVNFCADKVEYTSFEREPSNVD